MRYSFYLLSASILLAAGCATDHSYQGYYQSAQYQPARAEPGHYDMLGNYRPATSEPGTYLSGRWYRADPTYDETNPLAIDEAVGGTRLASSSVGRISADGDLASDVTCRNAANCYYVERQWTGSFLNPSKWSSLTTPYAD